MRTVRLENLDRSGLHDLFESIFPPPYGRNLDALHDILTCLNEPLTIQVHESSLLATLGDRYCDNLLGMLRDSAAENPNLTVTILE